MNREQAKQLAPFLDPLAPADPKLYVARPRPPIAALREVWAFGPADGQDGLGPGTLVDDAIAISGGVTQTFLKLLYDALRRAVVNARSADRDELLIDRALLDTVIDDARERMALRAMAMTD